MWPLNSPDLNPMNYAIWSVIQQRAHETRVHDIDELQLRLLHVWNGLEQSLIDDSRECMDIRVVPADINLDV